MPFRPLRSLRCAAILAVAGAALTAGPSMLGADWPRFRGPGNDGISRETGLAPTWPAAGPPVLWRRPLGEGYSAIVVADGRLFTMFADASHEHVIGLDAKTGQELWRYQLDTKYLDGQGNGPRSTPVVDDGVVYALGAKGQLAALDAATGTKVWAQDLKASFGARSPQWGISASPLIDGDLLLLDVGGRPGAALVALHKRSGVVAWKAEEDEPGYSVPIVVTLGGRRQVVFFTGTRVLGVDPDTGETLWKTGWKTNYEVNAAAPLFIPPDRIFVASGYGTGAGLFRIVGEGETFRVEEVWKSRGMKNHFSSSVHVDGVVYGFDNSIFKALDAATGEERWKARNLGHGSLVWAEGHLYVLGERGRLVLAEATPEAYREKAAFQLFNGKCWTVPTLADGRLYLRDEKEIVALDVTAPAGGDARAAR